MSISPFFTTLAIIFLVIPSIAAGSNAPSRLVDAPTAGSLSSRQYLLESQVFDGGGVVQRILVGLNDHVDVGVSYGGANIIGSKRIFWQPHVGFQARIRLIEESMRTPALSLGFDSQGEGPFFREGALKRFRYKSRGAYLAVSRNYRFLGNFGVHGGINYSLEIRDDDIDPSFWAGFDKSLGDSLDLCGEYDFAANDGDHARFVADRGYLNAAVKWRFGTSFSLEVNLRNLLRAEYLDIDGQTMRNPQPSRELRFSYRGAF